MKFGFAFNSCSDGLGILCGDNVFGHDTLTKRFSSNSFIVIIIFLMFLSHILIPILNQLSGILDLGPRWNE